VYTSKALTVLLAFALTLAATYSIPGPAETPTPDFNEAQVPALAALEPSPHIAHADNGEGAEPVRIYVPSLGLDVPIIPVGIDKKGNMDVPDGRTLSVGWYEDGTLPGSRGSAVLAAHVYAAFQRLRKIEPGAEIFIVTKDGTTLRFIAAEKKTYRLADVPAQKLFNRDDDAWLNLITCAGLWNRAMGTYDHRVVVYAKFVE